MLLSICFGIRVPNNHEEAMYLDKINGNTKWADSEKRECDEMDGIGAFRSLGVGAKVPSNYKLIKVHVVYAVKHDGRHKARLVANGNLTGPIIESNHSGVASLRSIRMIAFVGELNGLDAWGADISNAYLMLHTDERVCIIAGPEFGELEGHSLLIVRALYGLKFSGVSWHTRLAQVLSDMGFFPCPMDPDVWMRDMGNYYEYIGTYVDDLCIASKDPERILGLLTSDCKFQLKGVGPMTYHLGCYFYRDEDGVLCQSPKKYIQRLMENHVRMFGSQPKQYSSPLEKGDHPELDTSEELDIEGIKQYQSIIGCLQWVIQLERFNISTATMSMSSFRANPRMGHLDRLKHIVGYLSKMRDGAIRYRVERPDLSQLPVDKYEWDNTVYGDIKEEIPSDVPKPLGKTVDTISYVDANLLHDLISGKAVSGTMHFLNQTPIDSYSKKQSTVETSTHGSEIVAARIAADQVIDLRLTLMYMGVPVGRSVVFRDNESVIKNTTVPHSRLNTRHCALSYHRIRSVIAAGILKFYHIPGKENPADIVSKHWGYQQIWKTLQPILFWCGDTGKLIKEEEKKKINPDQNKGE